ncbi:uncharacterized protein MONOS_13281 [Monocercomonoides exilis]|uniref:uncharacterized protein n=1 Tax=Monocercomonoides exilis TaxID=2049356 RepID=UPI00355A0EF7|nr:hypothetical protein MONOS_13281 [Monocercomonoides exilis]|eukprot:MONOS_13281.1-p1 / transcript=MONOS_13281.1 / gene=MONOS_13281 / organism=Monocercomonoides_exilis_PA203 / gene_product=unspecified product / transcript_product=unspecified product / location=Mono_scaffold00803:21657-22077(+) / protein_length=72 / sequence_SO=supercontig / SO=protein_coding / is_pseudo=false
MRGIRVPTEGKDMFLSALSSSPPKAPLTLSGTDSVAQRDLLSDRSRKEAETVVMRVFERESTNAGNMFTPP